MLWIVENCRRLLDSHLDSYIPTSLTCELSATLPLSRFLYFCPFRHSHSTHLTLTLKQTGGIPPSFTQSFTSSHRWPSSNGQQHFNESEERIYLLYSASRYYCTPIASCMIQFEHQNILCTTHNERGTYRDTVPSISRHCGVSVKSVHCD